ncbi:MAG: ABC transporter permease [Clostridiaceae bacterium]|jgi:putative hydroxymethylpyrimidine transport system permease protein|nr:ABC transporter permease [Clostridiaceae bacterium]
MKKSESTGQKNKYREYKLKIIPAAVALFFVILWQLAVDILKIEAFILPSPINIIKSLYLERKLLLSHTLVTLGEALIGFIIAIVAGMCFGLIMGFYKPVRIAFYPLFVVSQTIPLIILAPLFAIWFGFGFLPKVVIVVLVCFFPITVTFTQDLIKINEDLEFILKVMGASRWKSFVLARIPQAMPGLFSGLKIAATYSIMGAVISEWVGAQKGLGIFMTRAMTSFRTAVLFADVVLIVVLSLGLYKLIEFIEKKIINHIDYV